MQTLSLGYLSLPGATACDLIQAAHSSCVTTVGLRIGGRQPDEPGEWPIVGTHAFRELSALKADTATEVLNVSAHYLGAETDLDSYQPIIDTAAALGARFVCLSSYDPEEIRLADRLAQLAQTAQRSGLSLALEFVPYSATRTLEEAARVLTLSGEPNARILLDLLHFMRSQSSLASLRDLPSDRLAFVQICDGVKDAPPPHELAAEARGGRLYPGEGTFPLREILGLLPASIPIEIETPHPQMAGRPYQEQAATAVAAVQRYLNPLEYFK